MTWLHQIAPDLPPNVSLWIAAPEMLTILRSKCLQADAARDVGLLVLPSISMGKDAPEDIAPDHFPLVLRPDDEAKVNPLFKMTLVKDQHDLKVFLTSRTFIGCALIGQRFINGPNLVVHGTRTKWGEHLHQAAFLAQRKFGGTAVTIEPTALPPRLRRGVVPS